MANKIIKYVLNLIILVSYTFLLFTNNAFSNIAKISIISSEAIIFILMLLFKKLNYNKLSRFLYVLFVLEYIIVLGYYILNLCDFFNVFNSVTSFKNYILDSRGKGIVVYILIQAMQVVFLPIPAAVICIAGSLIYGPFLGGLYCSIGVLIGSIISFIIGKTFGHRIVEWIVGVDNCNKYTEIIRNKGGFFLVIAFLLPMFPDDILCLIAGITNMTMNNFLWITVITRPIGVICMSYFGSGYIIPFNGWGVYAWGIILVVSIIMIFITYKYQDQMQKFIINKVFRRKD